jgi:NitT/TauT family transport system ATP-binding protein
MGGMTMTMDAPAAAATTRAKLSVRHLGLSYTLPNGQPMQAIKDFSIELGDKEFGVIVGPSGCGKSSLLYLAAGLNEPTSGEILLNGKPVEGPGADRGMVFQSYTLFPWLTVRQNVAFGLKRKGIKGKAQNDIVGHYLDEVGLTGFADSYPKQLSGGMMQRVAIARALANDPEVLLMDEPFGALDSQTRSSMQKLLLKVWEHHHKTVLFVTHDIDEAILLGDRVFIMSARPGTLKEELVVPIARPRSLDMTMEPDFIALKRHILGLLHDEIDEED